MNKKSSNPERWENDIQKFKKDDRKRFPKKDLVLFAGSSTIRMWKNLNKDMRPLKILKRGFGGSRVADLIYYYDRIIKPYNPKAIVIYSGENDISSPVNGVLFSAEEVRDNFEELCNMIRKDFSEIPIFYISIKPPKKRFKFQDEMFKANGLIQTYCETQDLCFFIDIVPILSQGKKIKPKISKSDGVHLNRKGYRLITSIIRPYLLKKI